MLALLLACGPDIHSLYEAEREAALSVASERPADWQPDLVIAIGENALATAVDAAATAALATGANLTLALPLGASAKISPTFTVQKATLSPSDACAACLHFDLEGVGRVGWSLANLGDRFTAILEVGGVMELRVEDGHRVVAKPFRVGKVELKIGDVGSLSASPARLLQDFVRRAIGENLPPIPLADLAASGLPMRDLRLSTAAGQVRIEMLSNVPGARPATVGAPGPDAIILGLSETALGGLLRRAAFEKGLLQYDTAIDPRAIEVEGSTVRLDLRVWRLAGAGWYRDYEVQGDLALADKKLKLTPKTVVEVAQSPGAELADPIAALFESAILDAIASGLDRSLPAARREDVGAVGLRAVASQVRGENDTLIVEGELRVVKGKDE